MPVEFARYSKAERKAAKHIARRAVRMFQRFDIPYRRRDIEMDLSAVHAKTPLRLAELAKADDFNFAHDLGGIRANINRNTGELENCFMPRFTARAGARSPVSPAPREVEWHELSTRVRGALKRAMISSPRAAHEQGREKLIAEVDGFGAASWRELDSLFS